MKIPLDWLQWIQITCAQGGRDRLLINEWKQLLANQGVTIQNYFCEQCECKWSGFTPSSIKPAVILCFTRGEKKKKKNREGNSSTAMWTELIDNY